MPKQIAILGGGVAGLAAAYELTRLQRQGADVSFCLLEASGRLGGILETERRATPEGEFVIELGPDGWVSEKPWAREVIDELGLGDQLLPSNDTERVTWVWHDEQLQAMPDGMRMMVPTDLQAIQQTPLFSAEARAGYAAEPGRAEELKRAAPGQDESVASFVRRHFGEEVLRTIGAPLLGGIFGGDVEQLSVRAVMKPFVDMEREHGSLMLALQARAAQHAARGGSPKPSIFTSLTTGTGTLAEAMAATLAPADVKLGRRVTALTREGTRWRVHVEFATDSQGYTSETMLADEVLVALPVLRARELLGTLSPEVKAPMRMQTSSAAVVAFGFMAEQKVQWPKGFGFLVPPLSASGGGLLAGTFCDQKYSHRVPPGARLIRAYYGGVDVADNGAELPVSGTRSLPYTRAFEDLQRVLGPLPEPAFRVERIWPRALPQYAVGHLERMDELDTRVSHMGHLHLLGNGYRGVGLPDLIRDGRAAARDLAQ